MPQCLDSSLIGIRCGSTNLIESTTDTFLNDLPGLNLVLSAMTADAETVTGETLFQRCIDMGIRLAESDFKTALRKEVQLYNVVNRYRYGEYSHDGAFTTTTDTPTGMIIQKVGQDEYIKPELEYIEMLIETGPGTNRNIDLVADGIPLDPISWTPQQGYNRINLNVSFGQSLEITTDMTGLSFSDNGSHSACCCMYAACPCEQCVSVRPFSGHTFSGMTAVVVCRGDLCPIMEVYKDDFALAAMYRAGAFFLEELISTQRINDYVRGGKEWAMSQLGRWMGAVDPLTGLWKKGEYQHLLENLVETSARTIKVSGSNAFACSTATVSYFIP